MMGPGVVFSPWRTPGRKAHPGPRLCPVEQGPPLEGQVAVSLRVGSSIQPGSVLRPLLSGSFLSIFGVKTPGSEPTWRMSGGSGHSERLQTHLLWILLFPESKLRMGHQSGEDRFKQRTCWLTLALLGRYPQAGKV